MPYTITCGCGKKIRSNKTGRCVDCYKAQFVAAPPAPVAPEDALKADQQRREEVDRFKELQGRYDVALDRIADLEDTLGWINELKTAVDHTTRIEPHYGSGTSEATPVVVASDWHYEELVTPAQTNGLNESNLDIANRKIEKFWQSTLRLIQLLNKDVRIETVVLALLGDFITNDIHEELVENVALRPIHAIIEVQNRIIAGLDFLLNNSPYNFKIVCRVGNHSRTTHKTNFSQENGHSLEHFMYVNLASLYRNEPRLQFVIQDGYHIYMDVYDVTLRFHHGHAIKYGGGIGGLFIPAYKAISQWSKGRSADLDVFGHFHQTKDGGNFLCNGSLIGYNSFAVTIKADYEPPKQSLFLVDKKRGRTCTWPVLV